MSSETPHDGHEQEEPNNTPFRSWSSTHQPRFWSKAEAPQKIPPMSVTLSTAQSLMSWLNDEAPMNIVFMLVTSEVSQAPMSWSKTEALLNIPSINVTPEVSHAPMS